MVNFSEDTDLQFIPGMLITFWCHSKGSSPFKNVSMENPDTRNTITVI